MTMLKELYSKLSLNQLISVNKSILYKISRKMHEAGFKIVSSESFTPMLVIFTVSSEIHEAEDLIILNLNIYNVLSKCFTLDNWSIKSLVALSKILVEIDRKNLESIAFIICANPLALNNYFKNENTILNKDVRVFHLAPTNLYFSLFQKTINYLILEHENGFNLKSTFERVFQELVNTNVLLNESNNYLTNYVIKEEFYDVFTIGGSLLKAYTIVGGSNSKTPILVGLETSPCVNAKTIIDELRKSLNKIGVSVKNFLEFSSVHIPPFNALYKIMERAYIEVIGEHPYIDWFTIPSTVEVFNKFFKTSSQLIFGPGVVTKPVGKRVFDDQFALFIKIFNRYLKIRRGV